MSGHEEKPIRLAVNGGTGFNILLPANPKWKISTLQKHIVDTYNDIAANQHAMEQAVAVRAIKNKGCYLAKNHKVGDCFDDWDEIICQVILGKPEHKENKAAEQAQTHKNNNSSKHHQKSEDKSQEKEKKVVKADNKHQNKNLPSTEEVMKKLKQAKEEQNKQTKGVHSSINDDKLMELVKKNMESKLKEGKSEKPKETSREDAHEDKKSKKDKKSKAKVLVLEQEDS